MPKEITRQDLELIKKELDHRRLVLRPQLIQAVKEARAFGDLSENFEYKAAKQEKNRNDSRCRYLENVIRTARVVEDRSDRNSVGLYDYVTLYTEDDGQTTHFQVVTSMRQDALHGRISKESPVGRAILGQRVGARVYVQISESSGYYAKIQAIVKGEDDGTAPLVSY